MIKQIVTAIAAAVAFAVLAILHNALTLDVPSMLGAYALEAILLFVFFGVICTLIFIEVHNAKTKKMKEDFKSLQARIQELERMSNSYKNALDDLREVDVEAHRLRTLIEIKKDKQSNQ